MQTAVHHTLRKAGPRSGISRPLKKLTLEITKKCYNKCVYCSAYESEEAHRILNLEDAKQVIDQLVEIGGQELSISGGEPLLHPNWSDIAIYAKNKGLKIRLFSCGILSKGQKKRKKFLSTIDKISEIGFDSVEITLHAPYAELHDEITTVSGSFRNTYHFIRLLSAKTSSLEINFVPLQINADELEELVDFVIKLKISESPRLNILRFIPQGRGRDNKAWLSLTKEDFGRLLKVILRLSKRKGIDVHLGHPSDFRFLIDNSCAPKPCSAGKEQCMIKITGDVIPCPAFGDMSEWIAGNIFHQTLGSIWKESPVFYHLREFNYEYLDGDCRICNKLELCQGRCPAQRIRENGDLYRGPDPDCPKGYIKHA